MIRKTSHVHYSDTTKVFLIFITDANGFCRASVVALGAQFTNQDPDPDQEPDQEPDQGPRDGQRRIKQGWLSRGSPGLFQSVGSKLPPEQFLH